MKLKTETGSIYEIDFWARKFRRLSGEGRPTARTGADGEWKEYHSITVPAVGHGILVMWNDSGKATGTSKITEIIEETEGDLSFFKSMGNQLALRLGMPSC